jgi:hypothetical protein
MDSKDLFANFCLAAMIDGKLGKSEKKFLGAKAQALKLNQADANDILKKVASGEITGFKKPDSAAARRKLYEECAALLRADQKLTGEEQEFLRRLGNALEIDEEDMKKAAAPSRKKG